jgi:very-short-patch-repair endonuclease
VNKDVNNYLPGHNCRKYTYVAPKTLITLCKCGCGKPVTKAANLYILGHSRKGIAPWNKGKPASNAHKANLRLNRSPKAGTQKGNTPWNKGSQSGWSKGLTKYTSKALWQSAERRIGGKRNEQTKAKMRESRIAAMCAHRGRFKDTRPEVLMKTELTLRNIDFTHQYYIKTARHVVDFFIEPNIVIECDGDYWHNRPGAKENDARLTGLMTENGFEVYRFWEHEICKNVKECVENILLTSDKFN